MKRDWSYIMSNLERLEKIKLPDGSFFMYNISNYFLTVEHFTKKTTPPKNIYIGEVNPEFDGVVNNGRHVHKTKISGCFHMLELWENYLKNIHQNDRQGNQSL